MFDLSKTNRSNPDANFFASKSFFPKAKSKPCHITALSLAHNPLAIDPSSEFSRSHYSKDNFQRVLLRNVLTPSTPQLFSRRTSSTNEKIGRTLQNTKTLPTEAFNKWRNEDKCHLLFVGEGILDKEEKNKTFKRFDDALITHTSWMKSFDQEKTIKDLLFRQLDYNEKSKEVLKKTLNSFHKGSVNELIDKITIFQKKIVRMPPVKKKKKKPQSYLKLNEDYGGFGDSLKRRSRISFFFGIF